MADQVIQSEAIRREAAFESRLAHRLDEADRLGDDAGTSLNEYCARHATSHSTD